MLSKTLDEMITEALSYAKMIPPSALEEHRETVVLCRTMDEPCTMKIGSELLGEEHENTSESMTTAEHPALARQLTDPPAAARAGAGPMPFTLSEQGKMPEQRSSLDVSAKGVSIMIVSQS
jgi:hypothetical protein